MAFSPIFTYPRSAPCHFHRRYCPLSTAFPPGLVLRAWTPLGVLGVLGFLALTTCTLGDRRPVACTGGPPSEYLSLPTCPPTWLWGGVLQRLRPSVLRVCPIHHLQVSSCIGPCWFPLVFPSSALHVLDVFSQRQTFIIAQTDVYKICHHPRDRRMSLWGP